MMHNKKINDIFKILSRLRKLETTERYKVSLKREARNSVAEHSWRLALLVLFIASEFKVRINIEHALALALLHDMAELTTGDIDAYAQIMLGKKFKDVKLRLEESAVHDITKDIAFGEKIFGLWEEYERQETLEAKFVKALDKIEGFLHISEVGVESYIQDEFYAEYADDAIRVFDEAYEQFHELTDFLDVIKKDLKEQFANAGIAWVERKHK